MADEYYQHSDIVIRFDVFKDGGKEIPSDAWVLVYDPDKEYLKKDKATIKGNEVRYILKGKDVEKIGKYTFVFRVRIRQLGNYTHIVKVTSQKLPVPVERK